MKTIKIAAVLIVLLAILTIPASASTGVSLLTWVHTSDGMGEGSPATYPDTFAIAFSPNYANDETVYAATYIGVYKSTDKGLTWTNKLASSLPAIISLSVSPADPTGNTMIGAVDDGILQTTNGWDNTWGIGPGGFTVSFAVYSPDAVNDHMIFAGTEDNGIWTWTGSDPWVDIDNYFMTSKITGIVFDPNYAMNHILYAATYGSGVWKGNGGAHFSHWSWEILNEGLDTTNKRFVNAIAISPNFVNDQTLFIASDGVGIYKSIDAGAHWTVSYNNLSFQTLLFSPNYAKDRTIFAGEDGSGMYRSMDSGVTWSQMNHGFADPVHAGSVLSLAFAPGKPRILFAGLWGGGGGGGDRRRGVAVLVPIQSGIHAILNKVIQAIHVFRDLILI